MTTVLCYLTMLTAILGIFDYRWFFVGIVTLFINGLMLVIKDIFGGAP